METPFENFGNKVLGGALWISQLLQPGKAEFAKDSSLCGSGMYARCQGMEASKMLRPPKCLEVLSVLSNWWLAGSCGVTVVVSSPYKIVETVPRHPFPSPNPLPNTVKLLQS